MKAVPGYQVVLEFLFHFFSERILVQLLSDIYTSSTSRYFVCSLYRLTLVHGVLEEQPAHSRLNLQARAPGMPHIRNASYVPILEPGGTTPVESTATGNQSRLTVRPEFYPHAQGGLREQLARSLIGLTTKVPGSTSTNRIVNIEALTPGGTTPVVTTATEY